VLRVANHMHCQPIILFKTAYQSLTMAVKFYQIQGFSSNFKSFCSSTYEKILKFIPYLENNALTDLQNIRKSAQNYNSNSANSSEISSNPCSLAGLLKSNPLLANKVSIVKDGFWCRIFKTSKKSRTTSRGVMC